MGAKQKDPSFGDRMKKARLAVGMTQGQVGARFGVSAQAVKGWEDGSMPAADRFVEVCELYGITVHYALTGVESKEQKENNVVKHISQAGGRVVPKLSSVEVLDRVNGRNTNVQSFAHTQFPCSEQSYIWTIPDRSNAPEYMPGDVVVIDPEIEPVPGDMVFAVMGDDEPIFRTYEISENGKILLKPKNSSWGRGVEISPGEDGQILGVMSERTSPRRM